MTQTMTQGSPATTTVLPRISACLLRGVSHSYGSQVVVHPLDLDLAGGSLLVVRGANGSGKSTLLRIICGLLRPTTGERTADGTALLLASGDGARRRDRVEDALRTVAAISAGEVRGGVASVLAGVGLPPTLARRRVAELSSGQRDRLTLAVAEVAGADLVCLDEPSAHMDSGGSETVAQSVRRLRARGCSVVVATHDPGLDSLPADTVLTLDAGRVVRVLP